MGSTTCTRSPAVTPTDGRPAPATQIETIHEGLGRQSGSDERAAARIDPTPESVPRANREPTCRVRVVTVWRDGSSAVEPGPRQPRRASAARVDQPNRWTGPLCPLVVDPLGERGRSAGKLVPNQLDVEIPARRAARATALQPTRDRFTIDPFPDASTGDPHSPAGPGAVGLTPIRIRGRRLRT